MRSNVLIVMKQQDAAEQISGVLSSQGFRVVDVCQSGTQALRAASNFPCEIVLTGFSLTDMSGIAFAENLQENTPATVLMMVPADQISYVLQNTEHLDLVCLPRPVTPQGLSAAIEMILQYRNRITRMKSETAKLKDGLERRALAEKAKTALMNSLGLSEADAWRRIQRQSMDTGKPLDVVARHMLEIYGKKQPN